MRAGRSHVNQSAVRYAVSEYADENLAEVLAERPLTVAELREMVKPLLGALAYIHREGLVHGHVKPANIMAVADKLKLSVDGVTLVGEPGARSRHTRPLRSTGVCRARLLAGGRCLVVRCNRGRGLNAAAAGVRRAETGSGAARVDAPPSFCPSRVHA
ncbi:MAG: hypothetical protein WDO73_01905 [Ignavibacteriota bacterium]